MAVAALVTWILTAGGGAVLITTWKNRRRGSSNSRLPAPLVFGHAGLAVLGLVLWIVYLANDSDTLARVTFFVVLVVAVLGFTMLAPWLARAARAMSTPTRDRRTTSRSPSWPHTGCSPR